MAADRVALLALHKNAASTENICGGFSFAKNIYRADCSRLRVAGAVELRWWNGRNVVRLRRNHGRQWHRKWDRERDRKWRLQWWRYQQQCLRRNFRGPRGKFEWLPAVPGEQCLESGYFRCVGGSQFGGDR